MATLLEANVTEKAAVRGAIEVTDADLVAIADRVGAVVQQAIAVTMVLPKSMSRS